MSLSAAFRRVETGEKSMHDTAKSLLRTWLFHRIDAAARTWLESRLELLAGDPGDPGDRALAIAFGLLPRRLGQGMLTLSAAEQAAAQACLPGWCPAHWSRVDAGRILLLASLPGAGFAQRFRTLCQTAEMGESISLYRGLPLYPEPEALEPQVGEGLRGNIKSVFEAIAHDNPYPEAYFDTHRWNHMVLKALFIGSRLAPIQGLDARANPELARIMGDFAHERWAAGREVPHEIWRCIGPYAQGSALDDLARVLDTGTPLEQRAAALALAASPDPAAPGLLRQVPEIAAEIASGRLTWAVLQPTEAA
jgi:hypothetical protein